MKNLLVRITAILFMLFGTVDRKSTRLNSSHTEIYTLSLHDALPISAIININYNKYPNQRWSYEEPISTNHGNFIHVIRDSRSEEHTSELQSHRDLHSFPTRRSSDLGDHKHKLQ